MDKLLNDDKVKEFCADIPTALLFCRPIFVHDFEFRQKLEFRELNSPLTTVGNPTILMSCRH
jgi:hypothetical protein